MAISRLPSHMCKDALAQGKLVQILQQYQQNDIGIYAVYPHRQFLSAKVDVFIKFLRKVLEGHL